MLPGVAHAHAVADAAELEVHSAHPRVVEHEIVGGMAPDGRERAGHGEGAPAPGPETAERRGTPVPPAGLNPR